jgi:ribosomal-protein-alanine N-acetyltransferase
MIEGKLINIRHARKSDLPILVPLFNNLALRGQYLPHTMTSQATIERDFDKEDLSADGRERLLIVDKKDEIVGSLWHFRSVPYFNAREIGYSLFAMERRCAGITTEAVQLLCSYLFMSLLINRLEIRMDTRNIASERVAIKSGFTKEGVSRQANFIQGQHVDMNLYSLLRGEWERGLNAKPAANESV